MERDLIKPIAPEILCKFRIFWLVIDSNCVAPVFQGVDLCVIMEKRPHKTHYLTGFVQISEILLLAIHSNCVIPVFQGDDLCIYGKTIS